MYNKPRLRTQTGLTLIELVVFMVIIGVGLAGILNVLNFTLKNSANPIIVKQQIAIAESLLEEIESKPFTYCDPSDPNISDPAVITSPTACTVPMVMGPPASKDRYDQTNPFTQVADYKDFKMLNGIYPPTDKIIPIAGLGNYSASVAITQLNNDALTNPAAVSPGDGDLLRIDVTVTPPGQPPITLTGYRYRYAPNSP